VNLTVEGTNGEVIQVGRIAQQTATTFATTNASGERNFNHGLLADEITTSEDSTRLLNFFKIPISIRPD
jgi:hypothetical protein